MRNKNSSRNPFDPEVLEELNSFKFIFLSNLLMWGLWAIGFGLIVLFFYLGSFVTPYLSNFLEILYFNFVELNIILQFIFCGIFLVILLSTISTVSEII